MIDKVKKAGLKCPDCGYELVVLEDKVFCQNPECKINGHFRQVKPNGNV